MAQHTLVAVESQLDQAGAQPGFDLETFFGAVGSCGSFLGSEVAEFALRQSQARSPADVTAGQITDASGNEVPPILFLSMDQNLAAVLAAAEAGLPPFVYVVFITTGRWVTDAQPPFTINPESAAFRAAQLTVATRVQVGRLRVRAGRSWTRPSARTAACARCSPVPVAPARH